MSSTLAPAAGRNRLPVRSRDRRPALAALALLLVVGGGLGAGLIVYRTGQQVDVLAAARSIAPGHVIERSDLTTTRISGADNVTVPASAEGSFVGSVATTSIPSGALLNAKMFHASKGLIPSGGQALGIPVPSGQRPSTALVAGDVVQAYYVDKNSSTDSATAPTATAIADPVEVLDVSTSKSGDGSTIVSVLVDSTTAAALAIPASQSAILLTKLPLGTKPELTLTTK